MPETKPTLRREQIAGMNIHYIMWSLDYFLDTQQRLGFESIELWCAEPHVTLDHTGYFEAEVLAKKAADRGLRYRTSVPRTWSTHGSIALVSRSMSSGAWRTSSMASSLPRCWDATACP